MTLYGKALAKQVPAATTGNQARAMFGLMTASLANAYGTLSSYGPSTTTEVLAPALALAYQAIDADSVKAAQDYLDSTNAMLAGYYDHYGPIETINLVKMNAELKFDEEIAGTNFTMQGKIDGLGSLLDGRSVLLEHKTTGDSVAPDSDYWLRLRFNVQICQYLDAARKMGWDVGQIIYDVVRKPSIRPKHIGKGTSKRMETPDEYCDRLYKDSIARPAFYFARKEVTVLGSDLEMFNNQRFALCQVIEHYRMCERNLDGRDPESWPRNVSTDTCNFCIYKSFCLSNIAIDIANPPQGYSVKPFNPELNDTPTEEISTGATA